MSSSRAKPRTDDLDDPMMDVDEVARALGVEKRWVYRCAPQYGLVGFLVGKHLRFKRREVAEWLESRRAA